MPGSAVNKMPSSRSLVRQLALYSSPCSSSSPIVWGVASGGALGLLGYYIRIGAWHSATPYATAFNLGYYALTVPILCSMVVRRVQSLCWRLRVKRVLAARKAESDAINGTAGELDCFSDDDDDDVEYNTTATTNNNNNSVDLVRDDESSDYEILDRDSRRYSSRSSEQVDGRSIGSVNSTLSTTNSVDDSDTSGSSVGSNSSDGGVCILAANAKPTTPPPKPPRKRRCSSWYKEFLALPSRGARTLERNSSNATDNDHHHHHGDDNEPGKVGRFRERYDRWLMHGDRITVSDNNDGSDKTTTC